MTHDDIDYLVLDLHNFLFTNLGAAIDEDDDYIALSNFLHKKLDKFVTRDRNYN